MPKLRKYPAELSTPIFVNDLLLLWHQQSLEAFVIDAELKKLLLLFKHFGIDHGDPNAGLTLALHLARTHIRGFQIETARRRVGRPRNKRDKVLHLCSEIDRLRKSGLSVRSACMRLIKKPEWREYKNFKSLSNIYDKQAKARLDALAEGDTQIARDVRVLLSRQAPSKSRR